MSHSQALQSLQDLFRGARLDVKPVYPRSTSLSTMADMSPHTLGARLAAQLPAPRAMFDRWDAENHQATVTRGGGSVFELPSNSDPVFYAGGANAIDKTFQLFAYPVW